MGATLPTSGKVENYVLFCGSVKFFLVQGKFVSI